MVVMMMMMVMAHRSPCKSTAPPNARWAGGRRSAFVWGPCNLGMGVTARQKMFKWVTTNFHRMRQPIQINHTAKCTMGGGRRSAIFGAPLFWQWEVSPHHGGRRRRPPEKKYFKGTAANFHRTPPPSQINHTAKCTIRGGGRSAVFGVPAPWEWESSRHHCGRRRPPDKKIF